MRVYSQVIADHIENAAALAFHEMCGIELHPAVEGDAEAFAREIVHIAIEGHYTAILSLRFADDLIQESTKRIFELTEPTQVDTPKRCDVMREMANVMCGTLKEFFPKPCRLALPWVAALDTIEAPDNGWESYCRVLVSSQYGVLEATVTVR